MPARIPTIAAPELPAPRARQLARWRFRLLALTPIYKGGADPGGIDREYPFRGPGIRGQLRAWWRATSPLESVPELREREGALFGSVHEQHPRASLLRVGVLEARSEALDRAPDGLGYVLWVDREKGTTEPRYHAGARAELRLSVPGEHREELQRALLAWLLAGGYGSRSRRGMGAVWAEALDGEDFSWFPRIERPEDWLAALGALAPPEGKRSWPSLAGAKLAWKLGSGGRPALYRDALDALRAAVADFRAFRAMEHLGGRRFDGSRRLPEIQRDWQVIKQGQGKLQGWNAGLGLPLQYRSSGGKHFSGVRKLVPAVTPERMHYHPDRLPSPLLLKPVRLASGRYLAGAVLLRGWTEPELELRGGRNRLPVHGRARADAAVRFAARQLQRRGWAVFPLAGGAP